MKRLTQGHESSVDPFSLAGAFCPGCPGDYTFRLGFALLLRVAPHCCALPCRRRLLRVAPSAPVHKLCRWDRPPGCPEAGIPGAACCLPAASCPAACLLPAGRPYSACGLPRVAVPVRLYRRCRGPVSLPCILSAVPTVRASGCPVDGLSVSPMIRLQLAPRCGSSGSGW